MPTYHVDISRRTTILKAALLLCCMVPAVTGQGSQPYELAPAYVDVEYCQNIMQSVAGLKNWRLKSVSPDPNYRWSMIGDKPKGLQMNDNGKIYAKPKGLQVNDDGEIYGRPEAEGVYVFTVRIADASLPQATPRELPVQLVVTIPIVSLEPAVEPQAMNAEPLDFSSPGAVATNNLTSEGESDSANKKTLVETNKKTLVDALTETLKSTDDVDLQTYAATQLGNLGVDAAKAMTIGELVKISKSKNKKVKFAAIKSLARIMASGGGRDESASVAGVITDETGAPVPRAAIKLTGRTGATVAETKTNAAGEYSLSALVPSLYEISAEHATFKSPSARKVDLRSGDEPGIDLGLEHKRRVTGGQFSRTILGFEQSGASASSSRRNFFLDLSVSIPFPVEQRRDLADFGPRTRIWGNTRITSVPNPDFDDDSISQFATSFNSNFAQTNVSEVVQAAEFIAGVEYRLTNTRTLLPSFAPETKQKFSFNFIAGAGVITPLNPRETSTNNIFAVSPEAVIRYPQLAGKDFVAFVSPDRDRFFRQYYAGLRFKTFYFDNGGRPLNRFPGILDLTFGQNEAITGGRLRGGIMRLEGFFPLPFQKANFLFLFGTAQVKLSRPNINDPLILDIAPPGTTPFDPGTAIITVPQINRDYYRLGIGVDAIQILRKILDSNKDPQ